MSTDRQIGRRNGWACMFQLGMGSDIDNFEIIGTIFDTKSGHRTLLY